MQQLRLYFPLLTSRQLLTGVNTAYTQEIKKLRTFGLKYIQPYLSNLQFRNYPYKITFIFYTSKETDMISALTTVSYILHLFEVHATLQSTDYRVLSKINVNLEVKKVDLFEQEGCLIIFEKIKH